MLHSKSLDGFLSDVPSTMSAALVRGFGEHGDAERVVEPPDERICDIISRKSSLKDLARRANRLPRDLPQTGESPLARQNKT